MRDKMRVGLALQPIATALFANSPFTENTPNGFLSFRSEIWRDTDHNRTGMLPFAFLDGFGFESYVDWALDVPMYFVMRGDRYHDMTSFTFRQFMEGLAPNDLPDPTPNMGDWKNHLSTLFPEVRLKTYLEMRGADGGPWRRLCALPAFWVGLLYDQTVARCCKGAGGRLDGGGAAGAARRRAAHGARDAVPRPHGPRHRPRGRSGIARDGLTRRADLRKRRRRRGLLSRIRSKRRWRWATRRRRTCSGNTRRAGAARSSRSSKSRSTDPSAAIDR